jgi:hypothetical protein
MLLFFAPATLHKLNGMAAAILKHLEGLVTYGAKLCSFAPAPANSAVVTCGACNSLKKSTLFVNSLPASELRVPVSNEPN